MDYELLLLYSEGKEIPRHEWKFQYTYPGTFSINDKREDGLNRWVKRAEFTTHAVKHTYRLYDPQIVWWNDGRFTVKGFERVSKDGITVSYAQSWLITLIDDPTKDERVFNERR